MTIGLSAVDQIIAVTGTQYAPENLDRGRLRAALEQSYFRYLVKVPKQQRRAAKYFAEASTIADHASELVRLIEHAPIMDRMAGYHSSDPDAPTPPSLTVLVAGLRALAAVAEEVAADAEPLDGSALEFWVHDLGKVYQHHFQKEPSGSQTATGAFGPFVRFAVAAMREFGVPASPHTVAGYIRQRG